ncbi:hypothetical protein HZA87_02115 [Candidatus Uhrbacteria bacterium]|nr:hypothetical protein [Candidatus Uhrbacteria bacterium]
MTSTLTLPSQRSQLPELLILTVAGLIMAIMMGLPSIGMFTFLTTHGILDGSDFYAYLGLVDAQIANSAVWMVAALIITTKHNWWPQGTNTPLLDFVQWPLGHKIVMGFFFASSSAWIIQAAKFLVSPTGTI